MTTPLVAAPVTAPAVSSAGSPAAAADPEAEAAFAALLAGVLGTPVEASGEEGAGATPAQGETATLLPDPALAAWAVAASVLQAPLAPPTPLTPAPTAGTGEAAGSSPLLTAALVAATAAAEAPGTAAGSAATATAAAPLPTATTTTTTAATTAAAVPAGPPTTAVPEAPAAAPALAPVAATGTPAELLGSDAPAPLVAAGPTAGTDAPAPAEDPVVEAAVPGVPVAAPAVPVQPPAVAAAQPAAALAALGTPAEVQHTATEQVRPALAELARGLSQSGGTASLVIRLDPPELGPVLVRLTVTQGRVDVHLRAPEVEAVTGLTAANADVARVLADHGLDLSSFDVDHGSLPGERQRDAQQDQARSSDRGTPGRDQGAENSSDATGVRVMDDASQTASDGPAETWL